MNKDTDFDGVLDWEESLWGTDPTKRDTNDDGVSDSVEVAKIKSVTGSGESNTGEGEEQLTETDKFSREFFSTIASLNQNGVMDQMTVETLSTSLADKIKNAAPRKVFVLSDIKTTPSDTAQTVKKYDDTLNSIYKKYPVKGSVIEILRKFTADENNIDVSVLSELDPIITQTKNIIAALLKVAVPQSLALLHLNFMNGLQRPIENLEDIQLYEADVIVALSGISQYEKNTALLKSATDTLGNAIAEKLK